MGGERAPWRWGAWLLGAAVAASLAWGGISVHLRAIGRWEAREAAARQDARRWAQRADSLSRVFHVETVHVARAVARWRTVRDTLWRLDTVPITRRETLLVAAAETAITACTRALGTCAEALEARDSVTVALRRQLVATQKQRPGWLARFGRTARDVGIGVGVGVLLSRVPR